MTHKQHPLGSGFTAASTADEVLAGIDLSGKNAVVTGGHVGLGLEATRALVKAGASVTVASRDPGRAAAALGETQGIEIGRLDLVDPSSIDAFVGRYLGSGRPLHILLNNAGVMAPAELTLDARGYEIQFATNHLGHFQLTSGLLPALRAAGGARVVNTTSGATRISGIRWDDPHFATGYDGHLAYAQSKTANVLFAVELDRRWSHDGIRGYAAHPGIIVGTNLGGSMPADQVRAMNLAMGLVDESGRPIIDPESGKKTPQQGAATIVFGATSPLLADTGGVYLKDNDISPLDDAADPTAQGADLIRSQNVVPHSIDPQSAQRLWTMTEQLIKT
ncbi:SDR family NAD(P)-dependent oxidoreductase [Actinomadura violacea]|uniref:SDR family NAD(P)-dependent oxidoreductase n=1 Tax=Actinomadura violacea TaxID=2819934 RepID=A0ABS3RN67_9ACTN|nr:SDR family NAD(P)-dependent oxidoreductase [Actinomadura violacea]MBO2458204.1 SDR family NAD(P)-dependent oxidoreductase [Actinomadura violacea]